MYGIVDEQNNRPLAQSKFLNIFKISACSCSYTLEADIFQESYGSQIPSGWDSTLLLTLLLIT